MRHNIKMDLRNTGHNGVGWICRPWDKEQWESSFEHNSGSLGSIKCVEFLQLTEQQQSSHEELL